MLQFQNSFILLFEFLQISMASKHQIHFLMTPRPSVWIFKLKAFQCVWILSRSHQARFRFSHVLIYRHKKVPSQKMLKVGMAAWYHTRMSCCLAIKASINSRRQYSYCKRDALTAENKSDMSPFGTAPPGEKCNIGSSRPGVSCGARLWKSVAAESGLVRSVRGEISE